MACTNERNKVARRGEVECEKKTACRRLPATQGEAGGRLSWKKKNVRECCELVSRSTCRPRQLRNLRWFNTMHVRTECQLLHTAWHWATSQKELMAEKFHDVACTCLCCNVFHQQPEHRPSRNNTPDTWKVRQGSTKILAAPPTKMYFTIMPITLNNCSAQSFLAKDGK